MTESLDIDLPASLWLAKLTPGLDPAQLLAPVEGCVPTQWLPTPLSTSIGFGGMLSLADVGHGVQPNLRPTGSLPLPGDRVIITRTGARVQAFGAIEITGVTLGRNGAVRIGHRPVFSFDTPVDLRSVRSRNRLLDSNWDALFGRPGQDRRLLPLVDELVALVFTALGFSLEALFGPAEIDRGSVTPLAAWSLDEQIDNIPIRTRTAERRVADGVVVFHGAHTALDADPLIESVEVFSEVPGRDLLLCMRRADLTYYTVAQSLCEGQTFRMNPTHRHLVTDEAASTLVAVETPQEWSLLELSPTESQLLHGTDPDEADTVLRALGFLDS